MLLVPVHNIIRVKGAFTIKFKYVRIQGRELAENTKEMMRLITPAMKLLEKYNHPFYVVYTNTPGEIVYEDEYQVVVKAGEDLLIEEVQPSWSSQYKKE